MVLPENVAVSRQGVVAVVAEHLLLNVVVGRGAEVGRVLQAAGTQRDAKRLHTLLRAT